MTELNNKIVHFLEKQGFVIVSTLDPDGNIHCSAKGIIGIEKEGIIFLMDLYRGNTFNNLKKDATISITAVDEHHFLGYTLKGRAKIINIKDINESLMKRWKEKLIKRISQRLIKNIKDEKKMHLHPEAEFPLPKYSIEMEVEKIADLAPAPIN